MIRSGQKALSDSARSSVGTQLVKYQLRKLYPDCSWSRLRLNTLSWIAYCLDICNFAGFPQDLDQLANLNSEKVICANSFVEIILFH